MQAIMFPGQGAQHEGMGRGVFEAFPEYIEQASDVLGYDLKDLCLNDDSGRLNDTRFTQPALYVVSALTFLQQVGEHGQAGDVYLGHSLGEYNALFAAGVFDFATGLQLVKRRGELMAGASGGGMAAVVGVDDEQVRSLLEDAGLTDVDLANYNTPTQTVISGPYSALQQAEAVFTKAGARYFPLKVSGAFHSRYMQQARTQYAEFVGGFVFGRPNTPVVANSTAAPYEASRLQQTLVEQLTCPVLWKQSIGYLLEQGVAEFVEIGGNVLGKLVKEIKASQPVSPRRPAPSDQSSDAVVEHHSSAAGAHADSTAPGSETFCRRYGARLAYVAGGMYKGNSSVRLVSRMADAGLLSFFGTGGLALREVEDSIARIQSQLPPGAPYGMNLVCRPEHTYAD
jgi:trans-AT polyketide synthase/acyltransferase/oxidoreductase domain-containing protein